MKSKILLICALTLTFVGCSSKSKSKNTEPETQPAVTSGVAVDDYIAGATVCGDVNGNGVLDAGVDEPCTTTDALGKYTFDVAVLTPLVLSGGTDIGTGEAFTGTFTAPVGSTVVTPLTTIVESLVKSGSSVEEASQTVSENLGLPSGTDLTTFDVVAAVQNGDAGAAQALAAQTKIQILLDVASKTVAAASTGTDEKSVSVAVASQIASLMKSGASVDSAESIEKVLNGTATSVLDATDAAKVEKASKATAEVTAKVTEKAKTAIESGGANALKESNEILKASSVTVAAAAVKAVVEGSDGADLGDIVVENITDNIALPTRPETNVPVTTGTPGEGA